MATNASASTLHFDPDLHPDDTLRAFDEFIQSFTYSRHVFKASRIVHRYDAQYSDPPKVFLDAAISRWKLISDDENPRSMTMTTFATNGDQRIELPNSLVYFRPNDCLLTGKLQNRMSPKEASDVRIFCIDHAKTPQTNRKSYTKEPPVPIFYTGSP